MTSSDELLKRGFDHPCRQTCSGWQQGFDRGAAEKDKEIAALKAQLAKLDSEELNEIWNAKPYIERLREENAKLKAAISKKNEVG